ncbi:RNA-binding cell elongation regulator Jag/EloR [Niallia sp. NCCP-28]|uniref:RNA-binding cell elongation regulator Jag/EloR n=1 Tax=Niallia sp. NCCP-28 TaxID=2934712 RepID=UPI002088E6C7|nr:RNA-binding cell elongation regulator Jag/EloR [Niallia sp. NCCP-28]GKU83882.1 protein jag [Niallia sp. NCCP-28]
MREVTAKGRTVETAVESALAQLKTTKNQAEIIVVDKGKKGFLGFGSRAAVVTVKRLNNSVEQAKEFLLDICKKMGVIADITVIEEGKNITFQINGQKIAILIGKRGQTLNSLQYITQLVINREADQYYHVQLNAEGYRERRKEALIQLAERIAQKAARTGKEISLEPMLSEERKIIHAALVSFKEVKTYSIGENNNRHIVIAPYRIK